MRTLTHVSRSVRSAVCTASIGLLAACGGGSGSPEPEARAAATTPSPASQPQANALANVSATGADSVAAVLASPAEAPAAEGVHVSTELLVRARADLAAGVGAAMQVRVNDAVIGQTTVQSTEPTDFRFALAAPLAAGARIDIVFTNDIKTDTEDRNLHVLFVSDGVRFEVPNSPTAVFDRGTGNKAFDGADTQPGVSAMWSNGALRLRWQPGSPAPANLGARNAAARFLQQASFGPSPADVDAVVSQGYERWLDAQMAQRWNGAYVNDIQARYALGDAYRPGGAQYRNRWPAQRFWAHVAQRPDTLRQRVAFALHQTFMVSQLGGDLFHHARAYASYVDTLHQHAFGNYRQLMQAMALHPVMGIYLSHMRNQPEDPAAGRLPDENFARELMQLFSIGLVELNPDGTPRLDAQGRPIETYTNADVMALAKVFTGWSWAFADAELTTHNFLWKSPKLGTAAEDTGVDLLPMKPYPGLHSTAAKTLFAGKTWARTIRANTDAATSLRLALDTLFKHPNVGPFVGRRLIQQLVTSHPSPGYVLRVGAAFDNNGAGVRGDMRAVVRAVLLDPEARNFLPDSTGKLREPVLRVAQWMRAFGVVSATGDFMVSEEGGAQMQRVFAAPSVFGDFRPGYVPPGTVFAARGQTVPEFQIVNESTTADWLNMAMRMNLYGLGWTGGTQDVTGRFDRLVAWFGNGELDAVLQELDTLLYAGHMPFEVRQDIAEAVAGIKGQTAADHLARARLAALMAMSATEYLVQR